MEKVLTSIFLMLFAVFQLFAQDMSHFSVSGKVIEFETNEALEYATIVLNDHNSESVLGCISDKNGNFHISVPEGTYTLSIEFISFKSKFYNNFILKKDTDIGVVKLKTNNETLEQVDINGNSDKVSYKLGKKTYLVEKDISAQNSSALELLENAPSVSLENGIPTIRGSAATVLINGKISAMSKAKALMNLQGSSIKKIEVLTSPSSRYSANMNGGIINIILKKGLDNGLNGSINTTVGIQEIYGVAATVNYKKDKVNIYTNTNLFHREPISNTSIDNEYTNGGIATSFLNEERKNIRKNNIFNTSLGMDYYIDDYNYLNIEGNYSKYNGDYNNTTLSNYLDENKLLLSSLEQKLNSDFEDDIYDLSVTFNHYFARENESFYFNASHSNDIENFDRTLEFNDIYPTYHQLAADTELIFENIDMTNTRWLSYYVFPTGEKSTLEMGTDGTLGKVDHNYVNEVLDAFDQFTPNPNTSNLLHYKENWFGFYMDFIRNSDKFSYLIGLRTEITNLDIELATTNEQSSQKYTDIFPSIQLEYNISETKMLSFAYRRGIARVGYPDLNPFELRISETVSYKGNLNLLPYYPNTFELNLVNSKDVKFNFSPTLYFRNYDNIIQNITVETGDLINGVPKLITTPINLGYLNYTGIELLSTYKPTEKIEFNSTFDLNYVVQDGVYEYTDSNNNVVVLDYGNSGFGGSIDLNTSISLPGNFDFQSLIKSNFMSQGAYSKRYAYTYMNATLSKDIINKKGTLSFSANDIFNSNITKRNRWTDDVNSISKSQWREPSFIFSFTYRFNQSKKDRSIDINKKDEQENY